MTPEPPISVGVFDGFSWIRCEGKGSFLNSSILKSFADQRLAAGERSLVVDLSACTGMDSTFMGTLAGIAARLSALDEGGTLQIAEPGERNRRSLEDLGLDFLMDIDPPAASWRGSIDTIRAALDAPPTGPLPRPQQARHVLEAHQTLSDLNPENAREFEGVVKTLEREIAKDEPTGNPRQD